MKILNPQKAHLQNYPSSSRTESRDRTPTHVQSFVSKLLVGKEQQTQPRPQGFSLKKWVGTRLQQTRNSQNGLKHWTEG